MGEAFTPGPWCYGAYGDANEYGVGVALNDYDHQLSGRVDHTDFIVAEPVASEVYGEANAALIAAAPAMFALLSNCRDAIASLDVGDLGWGEPGDGAQYPIRNEFLASIDAVLAKACPTPPVAATDNEGGER